MIGLATLLLAGAVVIGSDFYSDRRQALIAERNLLEMEWIEIETLLEDKTLWELRSVWLQTNQPKFTSTREIDDEIFSKALAEGVEGVTTSRQTLLATETSDYFVQAGVALTATGSLPSLMRWIYDLTPPESFRVIRNLKLNPDADDPEKAVAQLEILRWYAPASP